MRYLASMPLTFSLLALPVLSAPIAEGSLKDIAKRVPTFYGYDNAPGSGVTYSGTWTHLTNQGYNLYQSTESYTSQADAEVRFDSPNASYGIASVTIYSTKKSDRGDFSVYCGTGLIGTGNEYSSGEETDTQVVFDEEAGSKCVLPDGEDPYIVIKNDRGAENLAIDKVEIYYSGF